MVHSASGFQGIRVGVTEGATPRHEPLNGAGVRQPRIRVSFWCAKGHETRARVRATAGGTDPRSLGLPTLRRDGNPRRNQVLPWKKRQRRASRPTWKTLKSGAPAKTPKTCWPERWNGYDQEGPFRTSCSGTREAAFSSISHRVPGVRAVPPREPAPDWRRPGPAPRRRPCRHRPPPSTPLKPY